MKLADIIALAKAGYKPSDIKELLSIDEPKPDDKNDPDKKDDPDKKKTDPGKNNPEDDEDPFTKLVNDENNKNKKE